MHFKTAAEIKAQKEAAGKSSQQEEKLKAKIAEKANRKYARMAEESEKREAARKKAAEAKPKLVVDRSKVITAPALLASTPKTTTGPTPEKVLKKVIEAESKFYGGRPVQPKTEAKQVWDEASKQWVKRT